MSRGLYVEANIRGTLDRIWQLTQDPELHQRWDLRFSTISYVPRSVPSDPQRFTYATRIGFGLAVHGTGESIATRETANSVRTSSLRFWSNDSLSLISEGSGYWKYVPDTGGSIVRFFTWYDYQTRFSAPGRLADLVFRPLMVWATAWSFDRLRLWVEDEVPPEMVRTCTLIYTLSRVVIIFIWIWHGLVPKLLLHNADELAMLRAAGLGPQWLPWIGSAEILIGGAGLVFWRLRAYLSFTLAAMLVALVQVAVRSPQFLGAAFNPVSLNLSVFTLALVGRWAWRYTAFAGRCLRQPPPHMDESGHG